MRKEPAVLLALGRRPFPLTPLAYRLLFLHALILMIGGHYTYAKVPLGFWIRDLFARPGDGNRGLLPSVPRPGIECANG
jgi:uncharacterized membrane protein YjdF